ncbi:MAG: hypothetical protein C5B48_01375, partial [Candidatus Rokuibacteriota bacterium]
RLLRMTPPEIAGRGRQQIVKAMERMGVTGGMSDRRRSVFGELSRSAALDAVRERARAGDRLGAAQRLFEHWNERIKLRFFEGAVSSRATAMLNDAMPGAREQVLADAESICRGHFDLLGYHALSFGDPIDWHLDPVSGCRAPLVHWSRLDPLDRKSVGDAKVIWELNRHQWLVTLGQAYRLTGAERYAETFAASIRYWRRANPPGFGINWASSLEVALRLVAWCWALVLFRGARALSADLFAEMLGDIHDHARHVERHLSHYFSPNTHLTGEALGLYYAGLVFPELRLATRWRALGSRLLDAEGGRQVMKDGVHFELSTCYQRYTAEIYLHYLLLAGRNHAPVPDEIGVWLERLLDVLLALCHPDGTMPQIGDADGGFILPLMSRGPLDLRGLFATAAAVLLRPDYAWAAGGTAPEALWLLGPSGARALERLRPRPPALPASRLFADGGYVVMRSGWDRRAHQLIFDVGPLGCPVSAGHGHADLLSIQCAVFGQPYLVDPGTYVYTADSQWRDFFRSSAAHSTVTVDGLGQAAPSGPFAWRSRPAARLRRWLSTETFEIAEAEHSAYARLAGAVTHRRRVLWARPRYWVIVDDLLGAGEHEIALRFQFAPMQVSMVSSPWARARGTTGGLLLCPFSSVPLKAELKTGEPDPIQGWVSPDYGQRRPAPLLVYSVVTRLPLRIATLLLPVDDALAPPPTVSTRLGEGAGLIGLDLDGREAMYFGDREEVMYQFAAGVPSPAATAAKPRVWDPDRLNGGSD